MEYNDLEENITSEEAKVCHYLEEKGKPNDEIIAYLKFKRDTLNEYYSNRSSILKDTVGSIFFTTTAYYSTGTISNLCLGISLIGLIGAGYGLVRDKKTRDKYNSANESLGLSFVKKI